MREVQSIQLAQFSVKSNAFSSFEAYEKKYLYVNHEKPTSIRLIKTKEVLSNLGDVIRIPK